MKKIWMLYWSNVNIVLNKRFFSALFLFVSPHLLGVPASAGEGRNLESGCRRIVTLSPALTRVVLDLLGEQVFEKKVVGVSAYSELPRKSAIPQVASFNAINIEKIISLTPDCVFEAPGVLPKERVQALSSLLSKSKTKASVQSISMDRLDDIPRAYQQMGQQLGIADVEKNWVLPFQRRLKKLAGALSVRTVLVQLDDQPLIVLGGAPTFLSEGLQHLGVKNAFGSLNEQYPRVSLESARASGSVEIWILGEPEHPTRYQQMADAWRVRFPSWSVVRENKIKVILSRELTRPTLGFLDALEKVVQDAGT
jgi:vitamin B12 transport system substrate-binding protein